MKCVARDQQPAAGAVPGIANIQVIVTTTINDPTPALEAFAALRDWDLLVVADLKTPDRRVPNATVLSVAEQELLDRELSDLIGWNCIQRRNMGFLLAYRWGAEVIATVDDDNLPLDGWGQDVRVGLPTTARSFNSETTHWFDPLAVTAYPFLWHRGFPLPELPNRNYVETKPETFVPDIEAGFWFGDPDIDAVCRLEHRPEIDDFGTTFPLSSPLIGPFNSQNTFLSRAALHEYFCFPGIGRFDDIWASYHAQAQGLRTVYSAPSVRQTRHDHDLLRDLEQEVWGYLKTPPMLERLRTDPSAVLALLPAQARAAFAVYRRHLQKIDTDAKLSVN